MSVLSLENTFDVKAFCKHLKQYPKGQLVRNTNGLCILDILDAAFDLELRELISDESEIANMSIGDVLVLFEEPPPPIPHVLGECD